MEITKETLYDAFEDLVQSDEFHNKLWDFFKIVEQKNQEYGASWEMDGVITSLVDIKDKLYRVSNIWAQSGLVGNIIGYENLEDKLMDIFIRSLMALMKLEEMQRDKDV